MPSMVPSVECYSVTLSGLFGDGTWCALGARIVDQNIQPAETRNRTVYKVADRRILSDVRSNELDLGAKATQFVSERLTGLVTTARDDKTRALFRKSDGGGAADAGQRTGDQYDLAIAHIMPP